MNKGYEKVKHILVARSIERRILNEQIYYKQPKECKNCGKIIDYCKRGATFCNKSCSTQYNNKSRKIKRLCTMCGRELNRSQKTYCSRKCYLCSKFNRWTNDPIFLRWLNNEDVSEYISGKENSITRHELTETYKKSIKRHLLEEQRTNCLICKEPNRHNSKVLVFILDHIDGNWKNHKKNNLRLICPNCNSQLDTTTKKRTGGRLSRKFYRNLKTSSGTEV